MPKTSAGILLYRRRADAIEVFLVHPGGPYWARKEKGSWSIPKGEHAEDEDALAAAKREFREETGLPIEGRFEPLGEVKQRGGKIVRAWAVEGDCDPDAIESGTFEMEWPPRSGRRRTFPEVDRAGWFGLDVARELLVSGQVALVDELAARLANG
jgi:predicted NUDIX family NTP pyrophosphohydrolase